MSISRSAAAKCREFLDENEGQDHVLREARSRASFRPDRRPWMRLLGRAKFRAARRFDRSSKCLIFGGKRSRLSLRFDGPERILWLSGFVRIRPIEPGHFRRVSLPSAQSRFFVAKQTEIFRLATTKDASTHHDDRR